MNCNAVSSNAGTGLFIRIIALVSFLTLNPAHSACAAELYGRVLNNGSGMQNTPFVLCRPDKNQVAKVMTDQRGLYRFRDIDSGDYKLNVGNCESSNAKDIYVEPGLTRYDFHKQ